MLSMISVVLATYNEAQNLERCLTAVKKWAGEIIVVDGQSTDGTPELAEKLGARVINTSNKLMFHINKQMAMDQARGQLILQLDADEVVDPELAKFIKKIDERLDQLSPIQITQLPIKAWYLKRQNLFLGKFLTKGGQYPDPVIRLYVNGYARLPQKDVHEQMTVTGQIGWAQGHLIHYANPSFNDYLRKFNTYTSLRANQWHQEHIQITWFNNLKYLLLKPIITFSSLFFRHKGLVDGWPGLVFAVMSGSHFMIAYLKLWEIYYYENIS